MIIRAILRISLILFILVGSELAVKAQKVAVVLSGGGSKGVAHIGVLKALEENNIPVDYVAGTSMGAIVGALYASGYTPEEIEYLITSREASHWATGEISKNYLFYYKQEDPDASWINLQFNTLENFRSIIPTNIISPYSMDFAFMEFFSGPSAAAHYDFDKLFIPFRCVAADIDSNKAYVFQKGQLSTAVRASMTYPFYFKPIEVDGKLLFDGGMYNNFPVDIAEKDFQPDVIIGCKAAGNYKAPSQDDVISQIQNMLMAKTDYSIDSSKGVLIELDLGTINVVDFSRSKAFVDSGYKATMQVMDNIRQKVKRRSNQDDLSRKRSEFVFNQQSLVVDSVIIKGLTRSQSVYVRKQLKHKHKYITLNELKKGYFSLVADKKISFLYPELRYNDISGYYDLYLNIDRPETFVVQFGGNISSSAPNEAFIGLQYNFLGANAGTLYGNAYFGRFYNSFRLSARMDFPAKLPWFLEVDYTYNHFDFFKNTTYFFEDKDPSFLIENNNFASARIGIPTGSRSKLIGGCNIGTLVDEYYQVNTFSRSDTADRTYFDLVMPFVSYELNSLNRKQYATSGVRLYISLRYVSGRETNYPGTTSPKRSAYPQEMDYEKHHDYFNFRLTYDNYFESFRFLKLGFYGELYMSNQMFFNNYTASILSAPAFQPIPESKTLFLPKYRAHNYAAVGFKTVFSLFRNIDLRFENYLMQPYRQIEQDYTERTAKYGTAFSSRSYIGSSTLVYHSPLGPLSLSMNYYDRTRDSFSFFLNLGFIIFNKSIYD